MFDLCIFVVCAAQVYRTAAEKFAVELSSRQVEQLKSLVNQVVYLVLYLCLYLSLIGNLHSRDPNPCLPPTVCARMARAGLVAERSLVSRTFRNLRTSREEYLKNTSFAARWGIFSKYNFSINE